MPPYWPLCHSMLQADEDAADAAFLATLPFHDCVRFAKPLTMSPCVLEQLKKVEGANAAFLAATLGNLLRLLIATMPMFEQANPCCRQRKRLQMQLSWLVRRRMVVLILARGSAKRNL